MVSVTQGAARQRARPDAEREGSSEREQINPRLEPPEPGGEDRPSQKRPESTRRDRYETDAAAEGNEVRGMPEGKGQRRPRVSLTRENDRIRRGGAPTAFLPRP